MSDSRIMADDKYGRPYGRAEITEDNLVAFATAMGEVFGRDEVAKIAEAVNMSLAKISTRGFMVTALGDGAFDATGVGTQIKEATEEIKSILRERDRLEAEQVERRRVVLREQVERRRVVLREQVERRRVVLREQAWWEAVRYAEEIEHEQRIQAEKDEEAEIQQAIKSGSARRVPRKRREDVE